MERRPSRDEIRHLVRDLLREVGAAKAPRRVEASQTGSRAGAVASEDASLSERVRKALGNGGAVEVAMGGERDLNAFAQQVALCALERDLLGAIAANRVRFKLTGTVRSGVSPGAPPGAPPATPPGEAAARGGDRAFNWDKGVLNEARIAEIAKTHQRLVLGPKAVLTPLARDRARELQLEIARQKP